MKLTGKTTRQNGRGERRRWDWIPAARLLTCLLLVVVCGALAVDRKSVFLDKMDGFETYIHEAARQAELKIEFIEEAEHPDLKVMLGKRFKSVQAEVMYKKNTGRNEDTTFRVVDVKTGKELLIFNFRMSNDENARRRIAQDFVRQLSGKLK